MDCRSKLRLADWQTPSLIGFKKAPIVKSTTNTHKGQIDKSRLADPRKAADLHRGLPAKRTMIWTASADAIGKENRECQ